MARQTEDNRRTVPLAVRFTEAERNTLTHAAHVAGVTVSDVLRSAALRQPMPPARPRRANRPSVKDADKLALALSAVGRIGSNVNQLARVANGGGWPEAEELHQAVSDIRWMRNTLMQSLGVSDSAPSQEPVAP